MLLSNNNSLTIFDFKKDKKISGWNIVDDNVMGGRSSGQMFLSNDATR